MKLYDWLRHRVPWQVAVVITALWIAGLLALAIIFAEGPAAEFRYGNL